VWQVLLYYGKQTVHRLCTCMCVLLRTHQILYLRETFVRGEKHQLSREKKIDCSNENVESSLYRNIAVFHLLSLRGQFRKVEWRGLVYELSSGKWDSPKLSQLYNKPKHFDSSIVDGG